MKNEWLAYCEDENIEFNFGFPKAGVDFGLGWSLS